MDMSVQLVDAKLRVREETGKSVQNDVALWPANRGQCLVRLENVFLAKNGGLYRASII